VRLKRAEARTSTGRRNDGPPGTSEVKCSALNQAGTSTTGTHRSCNEPINSSCDDLHNALIIRMPLSPGIGHSRCRVLGVTSADLIVCMTMKYSVSYY